MRTYSNRGFAHHGAIANARGDKVWAYESSNALTPSIWVTATDEDHSVAVELDLDSVDSLIAALTDLRRNHYLQEDQ